MLCQHIHQFTRYFSIFHDIPLEVVTTNVSSGEGFGVESYFMFGYKG